MSERTKAPVGGERRKNLVERKWRSGVLGWKWLMTGKGRCISESEFLLVGTRQRKAGEKCCRTKVTDCSLRNWNCSWHGKDGRKAENKCGWSGMLREERNGEN